MSPTKQLAGAPTISKYLTADNDVVKKAVGNVVSIIQAAASQSVQAVRRNRECISDATDHLDGIFIKELQFSQPAELKEIEVIEQELSSYFEQAVYKQAFATTLNTELQQRIDKLEEREAELQKKEQNIEKIIHARVAYAEEKAKRDSTTSKGLLESALSKAVKVFDQNKITRFACSTIARFQDEFESIRDTRDVEHVTKLFQETIEPFQTVKMVADKEGKLTKVITSSFSEDCYQDLFFFFYKYYNELVDFYDSDHRLPSTADELGRIFRQKRKGAEQIISQMHKRA